MQWAVRDRAMGVGHVAAMLVLGVSYTLAPAPAHAQLIGDEVRGDQRVCTYFGSETLPNDEVVARTLTVGLGQGCPATAPYHDPNAPIPPNARLMGQSTASGGRVCVFEQGGVQYQRAIPLTAECTMTPALLDRELAGGR